ncbi:MAG: VCBS repeat-containing protein [Deltaproteobacteria bacterium]|nr:VCBS repeat-containing protein [Candidatus Tharpella sp.]
MKSKYKFCKSCVQFALCLAALISLLVSLPAEAADPVTRFQPLSGYLVQVGPQGVVVDCGHKKGVAVGDLFAVLQPSSPLIHPVTGQPMGVQERLVASLKVQRVEADYAICKPLKRYLRIPLVRGSLVKRFAFMAAIFIDLNGNGVELFSRVREALPQLDWADYGVGLQHRQSLRRPGGPGAMGYDLYVVNQGSNMTFYNGDQELVAAWKSVNFSRMGNVQGADGSRVSRKGGKGRYGLSTDDTDKPILTRYRQMAEVNIVVKGIDVGDLDNDGIPEMIFTDGEKIYVYQMTDRGLKYNYRYHFNKWGSIVNVLVGDIDGDQRDEILINVLKESEDGFSSFVITKKGKKYRVMADHIPFVMGFLGGKSVADKGVYFVGQGFDEEALFNNKVSRLKFSQGEVLSVGKFTVPMGFTLPGAVYDDINNDHIKELCFVNQQNFIEIYQGRKRLWVSDERLAGSLHSVQYEVGTEKVNYTE